jgi:hypothetical protein
MGRSKTALTTEKIVVLAQVPSASINTAMVANGGDFAGVRIP